MVQFFIQPDSEISPAVQLFDQISFAITSCAYASGEQLPSTRQLAQQTGLHRNTINKVYQQLKKAGLVTAKGGSGMYAAPPKQELVSEEASVQIIRQTLNQLLSLGYSLAQAQTLFNHEVNWRLSCSAKLIVTSGKEDAGVAQIIAAELEEALDIPLQIIAIEELGKTLDQLEQNIRASTIVTNRYFAETVHRLVGDRPIRIFTIDIYNYSPEIARIRKLPLNSSVGLVSISTGVLRLAESLIQSIRKDVLVIAVLPQDTYRLQSMLKTVDLVIAGHSLAAVKQAIADVDRIRPLEVIYSGKYVAAESIKALKLELGID
ncbi:putative transcriptional regulator [Synechococcus sp. PCC 7502]|uniref:GntR family transcriptional regulator n=1 Tax=Synechococcus sp. PCC 7502 TaxID=1173263 RepID=UPI00029FA376|nr:GntR family transcriptional regulator [Synechococcus sp. PCC 7502]AFY74431.1 putative transcriptional regulator [Synechococcus sp. PCC 7502]